MRRGQWQRGGGGGPAAAQTCEKCKSVGSIQTGSGLGMQTLDQNLTDLVRRNIISPAEARSKAKIPENFPG